MPKRKKISLVRIALMLLVVFLCLFLLYLTTQLTLVFCPDSWSQISRGDTLQSVLAGLGKPEGQCQPDKKGVLDCYPEGYERPPATSASRVLVYLGCDKAFVVFLDSSDKVESTWWGNS